MMRRPVVITLGITAVIVVLGIILVAAGFGYFYYTNNLNHNPEWAKGVEFGPTTDQQGCVDESLHRIREYPESTFSEKIEKVYIPSFASGCFSTSKPSKYFCDGVPRMKDVWDSLQYVVSKCDRAGLSGGTCHNVFRRVIKECKTHKQTVVSYPDD